MTILFKGKGCTFFAKWNHPPRIDIFFQKPFLRLMDDVPEKYLFIDSMFVYKETVVLTPDELIFTTKSFCYNLRILQTYLICAVDGK